MTKNKILIFITNIISVLIPLCIGGKIMILSFFAPNIINLTLFATLYKDDSKRSKCLSYLCISLILTLTTALFCVYKYYFSFLDVGGVMFITAFCIAFNTIPTLLISLIYLVTSLIDK